MVYGLKKFHCYAYGRHVKDLTDHKPLVSICTKLLSKTPRKLQILTMGPQQYSFSLQYRPSKEIPLADFLSHAPTGRPIKKVLLVVNNLMLHPIQDYRQAQIRRYTAEDATMMVLAIIISKR